MPRLSWKWTIEPFAVRTPKEPGCFVSPVGADEEVKEIVMRKKALSLLGVAFMIPMASEAGVQCLFKDSSSVSTPSKHCSKHCGGHADAQPVATLTMNMNEEWSKKGAFYRNASARCEGGNGCNYQTIGKPRTFNSGKSVDVTYKTWSIPVKIVIEADVCIVDL